MLILKKKIECNFIIVFLLNDNFLKYVIYFQFKDPSQSKYDKDLIHRTLIPVGNISRKKKFKRREFCKNIYFYKAQNIILCNSKETYM